MDQASAEAAEDAEFFRRYGPWQPFDPTEAAGLFDQLGIDWWVAGGLAAEAFHGVARGHDDIDVAIFRRDLPILRAAVEGRFDIWSAGSGSLRPVDDRFPEPPADSDQVWLREHALAPWRVDVLLNPDVDGHWQSRRDLAFLAPLESVTWTRDGIRYLNPEIVLAFKARHCRSKDEHDFAAIVPRLDASARGWLRDYLERCEPGHVWIDRLRAG